METTTIRIEEATKQLMDNSKIHHRETYDDLIKRILKEVTRVKGGKLK